MRRRKTGNEKREGTFARNLAWWRTQKNLTTKEASQKLGVAASTWSQWESGLRIPSVSYLGLLATVLGVPACSFLSEDLTECSKCLSRPQKCASRTGIHAA